MMRFAPDKHPSINLDPVPRILSELLVIHGVSTRMPNPPSPKTVSLLIKLRSTTDDDKPNDNCTANIPWIAPCCLPKQVTSNAEDNQWQEDVAEDCYHID